MYVDLIWILLKENMKPIYFENILYLNIIIFYSLLGFKIQICLELEVL
jgi:hypothetical protein